MDGFVTVQCFPWTWSCPHVLHTHSLIPSPTQFTHMYSLTDTQSHTHIYNYTHTHSHLLTHSLFLSHAHTHMHTLSLSHILYTLSLTESLTHPLPHTLAHTHRSIHKTHSHSHTQIIRYTVHTHNTHTHTHIQSFTHTQYTHNQNEINIQPEESVSACFGFFTDTISTSESSPSLHTTNTHINF